MTETVQSVENNAYSLNSEVTSGGLFDSEFTYAEGPCEYRCLKTHIILLLVLFALESEFST